MVTYTNNAGLDEPFFRRLKRDDYDKGESDFTATELGSPVRITHLKQKHDHERVVEAADMLFAMFGTALHKMAEEEAGPDAIAEKRFYALVVVDGKTYRVGFKGDHYGLTDGILVDYKATGLSSLSGDREEWDSQLNIGAYVLRANGFKVLGLRDTLLLKDWTMPAADRDPSLPLFAFARREVAFWGDAKTLKFMQEKIRAILAARAGGDAPQCSESERWVRDSDWAVIKPGAKAARRRFKLNEHVNAEREAREWFAANGKSGDEVVYRPGDSMRCRTWPRLGRSYCPVAQFCSFAQALRGASLFKENEDV